MFFVCRRAGLSCPGDPSYDDRILNSQCCHCTAPTASPATCVLLGKSITQNCLQGGVIQHNITIRKGETLQEQRWGTNWGTNKQSACFILVPTFRSWYDSSAGFPLNLSPHTVQTKCRPSFKGIQKQNDLGLSSKKKLEQFGAGKCLDSKGCYRHTELTAFPLYLKSTDPKHLAFGCTSELCLKHVTLMNLQNWTGSLQRRGLPRRILVFPASSWAGTNTKTAITVFGSDMPGPSQKAGNLKVCKDKKKKWWEIRVRKRAELLRNWRAKKIHSVSSYLFLKDFANLQG